MPRSNDSNDDKILSDPEPIEPPDSHEPPPEEATPKQNDEGFLDPDKAESIFEEAAENAHEDPGRPYEAEVLKAAATLKEKDRPTYERLKPEIGAAVDMRKWPSEVDKTLKDLEATASRQRTTKPVITDRADLHGMVEEACEALDELGGIYERGGELVRIFRDDEGVTVEPVSGKYRVREILSEAAHFEKLTQDGPKPKKPPNDVAGAICERRTWGVAPLEGVVDGACMLEDGTILTTEGYHPDARLYLRNGADITPPKSPTQADAHNALEKLLDLIQDFEFEKGNREAHESAWVSLLLTIIARPAIGRKEPTPLFLVEANQPGSGKTKLVEMACEIPMGKLPAPRPAPTGPNSDNEMRKTITAIARSGKPIVFFDNVKGTLGGGSLELALTGKKWSSRILQRSKDWSGHLMVTWAATSNSANVTADMARRIMLCRIDTRRDSPEERDDFTYPRIQQHIREHRAEYLRAALTILRAWHAAGQPDQGLQSWGSFEEWSRIIRNSIVFAGGADPYATREEVEGASKEKTRLRMVLEAWPDGLEMTSREIGEALRDGEIDYDGMTYQDHPVLDALDELLGTTQAQGIGTRLGFREGTPEGGRMLKKIHKDDGNYWTVVDT